MQLDLDDFELITASFELRYQPRFLIWDHIGAFYEGLSDKYPQLDLKHAEPSKTTVSINKLIDASINIDKALFVSSSGRKQIAGLKDVAAYCVPLLIERLNISTFTRIGLRLGYSKRCTSQQEASSFVLEAMPSVYTEGPHFGIHGTYLDPEFVIRYEGDVRGITLRLSARRQQLELTLPPEFSDVPDSQKNMNRFDALLDIDSYIHANTVADQVDVEEIIEGWVRLIRRDIRKVARWPHA